MSIHVGSHHRSHAMRDAVAHHHVLAASLLGLLIGLLMYAVGNMVLDTARAALTSAPLEATPTEQLPRRELPREWQWEPKEVQVEHMYNRPAPGRGDWIKDERR